MFSVISMLFDRFERLLAFRYLRSRKAEGFVSVIAGFSFMGIMLGVATLIIVMSVMNGFRAELIGRILGLNGHVTVYNKSGEFHDFLRLKNDIQAQSDVKHAFPMIERQSLLNIGSSSTGVLVRGLSLEDFNAKPILSESVIKGDVQDFTGKSLIIGTELAKRYQIQIGDEVSLLAPQTVSTAFGSMPRKASFTVVAVFDVEMYEYNNGFAFMPLDTAQIFYKFGAAVNMMEIYAASEAVSSDAVEAIKTIVDDQFVVNDWKETNGSFFNALKVERNVMFLILTLIIIVAAFNIISSMIMLVKDKGKDIAILRTMGATRRSILKIFILTGAFIGFVGTAVGATLGIAFALNIEAIRQFIEGMTGADLFAAEIYFLSQLPAQIDWTEVISVIVMALTISLLATLYPAWRAARLDPVEALRYE